ncbi:50S ribosomal protein L17 [Candidatus Parcubacteria bacterium]|nr:MAG: 50S ribosomal protein L17 [Candidatus Parcubacteria bacterium]
MQHKRKGKILSRKKESRNSMMRNLATSLVLYEEIKTTKSKAQALKPFVEKLIRLCKKNDINSKRQLLKILYSKKAVNKCQEILGPKYQQKYGGYTRITNVGSRKGDNAKMVKIEFV